MAYAIALSTLYRKPFCKNGRASRSEFWIAFAALIFVAALLQCARFIFSLQYPEQAPTAILVTALLTVPLQIILIFAATRRMHDLNKSGHWSSWALVVLFFGPLLFGILKGFISGFSRGYGQSVKLGSADKLNILEFAKNILHIIEIVQFFSVLICVIYLIFIIYLCCRRGSAGENRFGPEC